MWNAKRDKSVENQKVSCIIENRGFAIKYVLYCVMDKKLRTYNLWWGKYIGWKIDYIFLSLEIGG